MVKHEKFGYPHLVYHFILPLNKRDSKRQSKVT